MARQLSYRDDGGMSLIMIATRSGSVPLLQSLLIEVGQLQGNEVHLRDAHVYTYSICNIYTPETDFGDMSQYRTVFYYI